MSLVIRRNPTTFELGRALLLLHVILTLSAEFELFRAKLFAQIMASDEDTFEDKVYKYYIVHT